MVKHFTGEATDAEEKSLEAWRLLSSGNEKIYQQVKKTFELAGRHYSPATDSILDVDVPKEWERFLRNISEKEKTVSLVPQTKSSNTWWRIAAVVLLLITAGFAINYFVRQSSDLVFRTAQNSETIHLPDGSAVFLNRNSILAYSKKFNEKDRKVTLRGEAFFEVEKDPVRPFTIALDQAEVTVLGTSFNVQSYESRAEVEVTVETGVVKFEPTLLNETIELRPGEIGILRKDEKTLTSSLNEDINYLAWKTQRIVFEGSDLIAIAKALQTTYGVEVNVSDNVSSACRVTVTFTNQSLEAVLKVLKSTLDLTYKMEGNKIEITKAGC